MHQKKLIANGFLVVLEFFSVPDYAFNSGDLLNKTLISPYSITNTPLNHFNVYGSQWLFSSFIQNDGDILATGLTPIEQISGPGEGDNILINNGRIIVTTEPSGTGWSDVIQTSDDGSNIIINSGLMTTGGSNDGDGAASIIQSSVSGNNIITNESTGTISGGKGGGTGNGGNGIEISTTTGSSSVTNAGVIRAGDAGIGGTNGGTGIRGNNLSVVNSGTIEGGLVGSGRANAIEFSGGVNVLELRNGSNILGNVQAFSLSDTFILGGSEDSTLNVSAIGTQYLNFGVFEKQGSSIWTLVGTSNTVMDWNIREGVLAISDNGSLGASSGDLLFDGGGLQTLGNVATSRTTFVSANGATFITNENTTLDHSGVISGAGSLVKEGLGTLVLQGINTYLGGTSIASGVLSISQDANLGNATGGLVFNGGTLRNTGNISSNRAVSLDGNGTFETLADLTLNGVMGGVGSLLKSGSSALILNGKNTYIGTTLINEGTLSLGASGSIASSAVVNLTSSAAVLDIGSGSNQTIQDLIGVAGSQADIDGSLSFGTANSTTFSGVFQGTGELTKQGGGTVVLAGDSGGFTGNTLLKEGGLHITGSLASSNITVASGAFLSGGNGATIGKTVTVNGTLIGVGGEVLTMESLLLGSSSTLDVTLGSPSGDPLFIVNNDLTLDGTLSINQTQGFGAGVYRLMNYGGSLTDNGLETNNSNYKIQTSVANQVNLVNSTGVTLNFWDGSGPFNNGVVNGGTGTWNLTNDNWTDSSGTLNAPYKSNNAFAVFEGAAGTITIDNSDGQVSATGLQFAVDGYTLTGASLLLTEAATIRVGDGSFLGSAMTATIDAVLDGVDGLTKTDLGTLVLQGLNTYTGDTTIASGVLSISQNANLGNATGGLVFTGGTLRNTATITNSRSVSLNGEGTFETQADLILNGIINGTGALIKTGSSALILNSNNTFTGHTFINEGTLTLGAGGKIASSAGVNLTGSTGVLAIGSGSNQSIQDLAGVAGSLVNVDGSLLFGTVHSTEFAGAFQGTGELTKRGLGVFALTSDSSEFAGSMTVNEGVLNVNGILGGDLLINRDGSLRGSGTVGDVTVDGTIAPGNSIGTLTVSGNYTQTTNSVYEVEINSQGQSDFIDVSGTANIAGTVEVLGAPGTYVANTEYTILHADSGVTGQYDVLNQLMPFLDLNLNYDSNNVYLVVLRSAILFADLASTPNEIATANAVESLGAGNQVYDAMANLLNAQQVQRALNSLSGEIYASALGAFIEESRYLRSAVLNHLQQVFADRGSVFVDKFGKHIIDPQDGWSFWSDGYGSWGDLEGNGNAATLNRSTGGVFLGTDGMFGEAFRLGIVGGYSHSNFNVNTRSSSAVSENYYLGAYGGARFNSWGIRVGGAYAWDNVDINRDVIFPGFSNHLMSNFHAHTGQIFAETGYSMNVKRVELEPFVGIAYVNVDNDRWAERGGLSALRGEGSDHVFYSTLGARETSNLYKGERFTVSENILLGWQHAYNGLTPQVLQHFVSGGIPFQISGVPIAKDSLLIDAGLNWSNHPGHLNLRLSYIGQLSERVHDNGIAGVFSWRG
ncbi:autotransporter domain-containing protein [Legionella sp. WA2024007413]